MKKEMIEMWAVAFTPINNISQDRNPLYIAPLCCIMKPSSLQEFNSSFIFVP